MTRPSGRGARIAAGASLVAWCAATWWLSSLRDPEASVGVHVPLNDKIEHGAMYAMGGFLAACSASKLRPFPMLIAAVVFCGLWGTTDEIHQSFVPGRECSRMDLVADVAGGTLGALAYAGFAGRRRRRRSESMNPMNRRHGDDHDQARG